MDGFFVSFKPFLAEVLFLDNNHVLLHQSLGVTSLLAGKLSEFVFLFLRLNDGLDLV